MKENVSVVLNKIIKQYRSSYKIKRLVVLKSGMYSDV